jgi:hypothetical protein
VRLLSQGVWVRAIGEGCFDCRNRGKRKGCGSELGLEASVKVARDLAGEGRIHESVECLRKVLKDFPARCGLCFDFNALTHFRPSGSKEAFHGLSSASLYLYAA